MKKAHVLLLALLLFWRQRVADLSAGVRVGFLASLCSAAPCAEGGGGALRMCAVAVPEPAQAAPGGARRDWKPRPLCLLWRSYQWFPGRGSGEDASEWLARVVVVLGVGEAPYEDVFA